MNSMNYLGRIVSNFREFYNEINAATLTGAIDVVVVEQPDGTFNCSPFHVRFGKLGVLRSREKVVDIQINGEPQDIHMKLGDSGEAFFVEEVLSPDTEPIPEHLATSPIPVSEFEKLYIPDDKPRRKSIDLGFNNESDPIYANQVSDYSKRRYTDSQDQDYTLKKRDFVTRQISLGNIELGEHSNENISIVHLESINKHSDDETSETIFKMDNLEIETVPKDSFVLPDKQEVPIFELPKAEEPEKEKEPEIKNGKKKRRKKSIMKKKNAQRKVSTVTEANLTELNENRTLEEVKVTDSVTDKSSMESSHSETEMNSNSELAMASKAVPRETEFLFFSDTELTMNSVNDSRPNTPVQSDTEFEVSQRKGNDVPAGQSWAWGQLPNTPASNEISNNLTEQIPAQTTQAERNSMLSSMFSFMKQNKRMRHNGSPEGMYLADLSSGSIDPEITALYFPNSQSKRHRDADVDCESGNGPSLPNSPSSAEGAKSLDSDYEDHPKSDSIKRILQDVSLSLCGWTDHSKDNFIRYIVSFTDLCNNPSLLESPDMVVRIGDKYYSWRAATPILISMLVYQRQLPQSTIEQLCSMHMPNINIQDKSRKSEARGYSWWSWRRKDSSVNEKPTDSSVDVKQDVQNSISEETPSKENISFQTTVLPVTPDENSHVDISTTTIPLLETREEGYGGSQSSEDDDQAKHKLSIPVEMTQSMYGERFRKTLRLNSDEIMRLNLKEGMNEVEFSVTTAYQGTTRCKCHIYRWKYDDKIVISDIDGTITKSDVLGHILPIVGKDWAQSGVAQLFTKIKNNGYKLLYLSARAIGQARVTREYLRSIKQGDLSLPDGPLLLNPTSLISAFHREVIEKKPEQFKISCLSDIQALFPVDSNPFYAGYGNRINDVWAYRAVGIPIVRIFTINHKGELKHELTQTFQSSYSNMTSFVDQMFPPLMESANDYSQFVYWREPIGVIEDVQLTLN